MGGNFVWGTSRINFKASFFNIFISDLFFIKDDIDFASYAYDNAPFIVGKEVGDVIFKLQNASTNQMKANPDKCLLFVVLTRS